MKGRTKERAALCLAAAIAAAVCLCACGNLFSANSDETETQVSLSSEVAALLVDGGIQVESWTLLCYFASGDYIEKTSASGSFSLSFPDTDIAAVFAKPEISFPQNLDESAVPDIGAVYPFYCSLESSNPKSRARLELDFYGGVAAQAARHIFTGASSASSAYRLARAFNWSKFDNHIKTAERAVSYPLLIDMEKFLAAFFEGNTSMYWQTRSLETAETEIAIPEEVRAGGGAEIVFPYYYPNHVLEIESNGESAGLPETITLDLPNGQWFFLFPEGGKWLAVQAKDGKVSAMYSSESF